MFKRVCFIIAPIVVFAALQCAQAQAPPAQAPPAPAQCSVFNGQPCVYSVKFICGVQSPLPNLRPPSEPPVKPGNYATAVNIHNFHSTDVNVIIQKSAVIALPESQQPGPISSLGRVTLGPGQAFEIDCSDIVSLFPSFPPLPPFIKGFVLLRGAPGISFPTLSVTAVYTVQGATPSPDCEKCGAATAPGGPVSYTYES
jgi:hypothetical protein